MEVNEAMEKLGYTGKWQTLVFIVMIFMLMPTIVWNNCSFVFLGYIPEHHCKIPNNFSIQQWIPKNEDGKFESCSMFVNSSVSNETVYCTDGWEYEEQDIGTTIVNEWDLVCDNAYYAGISQVLFYLGEMAAFYLVGLADIFGRKPVSLFFLFLTSTTGLLISFSTSFPVFALGKLLHGIFSVPDGICGVYLTEMTSKINMEFIVLNSYAHWGITGSLLVVIWYFLKNWTYVLFITNLFGLLALPILIWFLPETVYWLHANNKIKKAEEVLINAGKLNNVQFTRPILMPPQNQNNFVENEKDFEEKTFIEKMKAIFKQIFKKDSKSNEKLKTQYSIKELYRNSHLLRHMSYGLFYLFNMLNIEGLTYISPAISTHRYLSTFLTFLFEIPCGFCGWVLAKKYSMRNTMVFCSLLMAFSIFMCVIFLLLTDEQVTNYTTIIFCTLAKFCVSVTMAIGYGYSCTLFPPNLRNRAYGLCRFISRIGIMSAAFSPYMLTVFPIGTYVIFAVSSLMSALILLILPDTSGLALPETIEDIENIYEKDKISENTKLSAEMTNFSSIKNKGAKD